MSSRPNASCAFSTAAKSASWSWTSSAIVSTASPYFSASGASVEASRAVAATLSPRSRAASAQTRPKPFDVPVMNQTLGSAIRAPWGSSAARGGCRHHAGHLLIPGGARVNAGVAADPPRFAAGLWAFAEGEVVPELELVLGRRRLHARPVDGEAEARARVARRIDRFEIDPDVEMGWRNHLEAGRAHFLGDFGDRFVQQLPHLRDLGDAVEERRGGDGEVVLHQVDRRARLFDQVGVEPL